MFAVPNRYNLLDRDILFPFHRKCNLQDGGVSEVNIFEDRLFFHGLRSTEPYRIGSNTC